MGDPLHGNKARSGRTSGRGTTADPPRTWGYAVYGR